MVSNTPLRLMHVIGAPGPGGAQMFYLRLVKSLATLDDVEVLNVVREGSWMADQLEKQGLDYKTAQFGGMFDFNTQRQIENYADDFSPDVVQGWMNRACKFLPKISQPTVGRMGGYYSLKYYKNCDWIVGNTQMICDYVRKKGWPVDQVDYLPNFIPAPHPDFREKREEVRSRYDIPQSAKVMMVAGRMHENKGIDLALYAMTMLPDNVYLLVLGEGPLEKDLKAAAESDGIMNRVRFVGWKPQISPIVSAADIWLVPSRFEPLGNVVLDAWVHGLPVVACAADGPKSLIQDEVNGLLVPLEDEKAIVKAVERLLSDKNLSQRLVMGGKSTFDENFSEDVVVARYLEFYQKILGR